MSRKSEKSGTPVVDPHTDREARKYEHPIVSREYILEHLDAKGQPLTFDELAADFGISDERDQDALIRRLNAMERAGQVIRNRKNAFGPVAKMDLVSGRVIGHPDGYGFLVPDEVGDDLFLSARQMRAVLHADRAVARVIGVDRRGRREGAIVEVLERNNKRVVGRFHMEHGIGVVIPSNKRISQDIAVPADFRGGALDGQIVVVDIVEQPTKHAQPIGRMVEVLGDHMAPGMEIDVAIRAFELPNTWPDDVAQEAKQFPAEPAEDSKKGREDLRKLPLVTIDGEDARDFDDAVFCEPQGKGWRLLVAIADVSSYVKPGAALDREASLRGTSVYFPERVIPMLPAQLSNGLCSLNPSVDRLCMVCELRVSASGNVTDYRFFQGVMRSHARLTYTEMAAMVVDKDAALRSTHKLLTPHLDELYALYQAFRLRREERGTIDFDTTETRIVFGEQRKIKRIEAVVRNDAHKIIEECMIAANVAAADFLLEHKMPALYRVHGGPNTDKLANLRELLGQLGLTLGGAHKPEPRHYAELLGMIRGRPDAHFIQTVLLRSLSQAVYSPENMGHFGLAYEAYAHFTSPIRRYPDLLVHRAIRQVLAGKKPDTFRYDHADMIAFGEHCSMTERRADDATRDAIDWLKCEYMMDKVGAIYDGIITSVTSFGFFVELDQIYVEGLVHVTALDNDYYHYDPVKHRMAGERTGSAYRLGDKVRVKVVRVDLDEKKIDFSLDEAPKKPKSTGKKRRRSTKKKKQR
ncbi:MAG: ribonuclease R [Gammaproteobacteria bacterium]|nr:MAG: ribonuclease R [Gammaproteobacteria bacterium]TND07136.1 MAG: ribonuclease R [Gammaproteobacteria bacterium]